MMSQPRATDRNPRKAVNDRTVASLKRRLSRLRFHLRQVKVPNQRLKKRLAGSNDWVDFITCDEGSPLPGGIGNIDYWKASYWTDFVGITVRTYDPKTGLWRIYWVDNTFSRTALASQFRNQDR